jgi:hypothetical protein
MNDFGGSKAEGRARGANRVMLANNFRAIVLILHDERDGASPFCAESLHNVDRRFQCDPLEKARTE